MSDLLVERIEAGGGEVRSGCEVTEIVFDDSGHAAGVRYRPTRAGESVEERAPVVFANAAPHVVADMLPEEARRPFMAPYVDKPLSISLFSIALGLERPPAEFGVSSYFTVLVPEWMTELRGVKRCADLLSTDPGDRLPAMIVCDPNHIDGGIHTGGELYTLDVAGVDRLANWEHLDEAAYRRRSHAWLEAIVAGLDAEWPGLAGAVVEQHIATARTMHEYLNTPEGAVYGWDYRVPEGIPRSGPLGSPETTVDGLWLASSFPAWVASPGPSAAVPLLLGPPWRLCTPHGNRREPAARPGSVEGSDGGCRLRPEPCRHLGRVGVDREV